jgi:hypothetical protein
MLGKASDEPRANDGDIDNRPKLFALVANPDEFKGIHQSVSQSLQIPKSLAGLAHIIDTLHDVIPLVRKEFGSSDDPTLNLRDWLETIGVPDSQNPFWADRKISGGRQHHKKRGPPVSPEAKPDAYEMPLFGVITHHPIWCALCFRSGDQTSENLTRSDAYRRLQAWYLAAYLGLLRKGQHTNFKSCIDKAGLLLRRIHRPEFATELDRFKDIHSAQSAYEKLESLSEGTSWLELGYGALARLLKEAFRAPQDEKLRTRGKGGGSTAGFAGKNRKERQTGANLIYPGHRLYHILLARESWFSDEDNAHVIFEGFELDPEVAGPLIDSGLDADEFEYTDGLQVDLLDIDDRAINSPTDLPPLGTLFGIANARARAQAMEVQFFRTRMDRIVIADLASIMSVLDELFLVSNSEFQDTRITVRHEAERLRNTVLMCAVMLVTGAGADDVRRMRAYYKASEVPRNFKLGYSPSQLVWLRQYADVPRKPLLLEGQASQIESTPRVVLSDVWGIGAQLGKPSGLSWFEHQKGTYERVFKLRIAPKLNAVGVPARWHRLDSLSDVVPSWFYGMEESNNLRVSILFDRSDLLASTPRFYTVLDRPALNTWYSLVMQRLMEAVKENGFKSSGQLFSGGSSIQLKDSFVGDDRTPKLDTVRDLIVGLRTKKMQCSSGCIHSLVEHHNVYTAYTALGLALVTGFRMVRTPIPDLRLIDAATGFMALQEKDRRDEAHARIVWLPERIRLQVNRYLEYLRCAWLEFPAGMTTVLEVKATKQRDRSRFGHGKFNLSLLNTLFFAEQTDERLVVHEMTGAMLKKHFDSVSPGRWVAENANRHFLRSFLANHGCPETVINAHIGHAHYGEGHWSPASGFDPFRYRSTIAPYLDALLDEVGYAELQA